MQIKTILFLLTIVLGLAACGGGQTAEEEAPKLTLEEQIQLKIGDELAKGERDEVIILDHEFGMTRKEVFQQKNKLMKEKRIYGIYKTKNTRIFVYDLNLKDIGKLVTYFDTYYHDDKLFKMECKPKIKKGQDVQEVQDAMVKLYSKKYGQPDFMVPTDTINNYNKAMWIKLNQMIEISRDKKEVMMSYTDLQEEEETLEDI